MIPSVLDKANMAHKEAKMLGKSMTVWYNEKLLEKLKIENNLKNRMRKALENGEFEMFLQPKIRLADMQMHSAELSCAGGFRNTG
ncbi:hypothetical protein [Clostridium sp. AM58-1XD]|uniref:hypothetical protein n=1 Tax=Clostridium sp. AM58-1XD TaxID=2292307 RepID=UPI0011C11722|nr:hypothetical protein [Clostridium sp. AM58-1XD]